MSCLSQEVFGVNLFCATSLFLLSIRTSEIHGYFKIFSRYRKRPVARNGLMIESRNWWNWEQMQHYVNSLSDNPTKNFLSVFDHFVGLALKGLTLMHINVFKKLKAMCLDRLKYVRWSSVRLECHSSVALLSVPRHTYYAVVWAAFAGNFCFIRDHI